MDLQAQRDLQLLSAVEKDSTVTQRTLAKGLGVALGLTNLYIKRLARKGYIKITTIPRNRIKYLLTPSGVAEKSRLTYEYMQYSLFYYRNIRQKLRGALSCLAEYGSKRLMIYGTGELAELAYLSLRETDLVLVGFVDGEANQTFMACPCVAVEALPEWDFDAVLIAELDDADKIREQLIQATVPSQKILALCPVGESKPNTPLPVGVGGSARG